MKIARAVMETEIQNKHDQKRKIKKQIGDIKFQLNSTLTLILYNTLLHRRNVAVKCRVKATTNRHLNKLGNLRNKRFTYSSNSNHISFIKNTVSNTSSYPLTEDEYNTLAFGLDQHIPTRTNNNIIDTKCELYFQSINRYANDIPDNKISHFKTRLRKICDRHNHIRVTYKFQKIVEKLSRNNSIMVLKQDKVRGVVVIDRKTYTEKCLNLLNTDSFIQLYHDPIKLIEEKIQRSIRKIRNNLTKQEYSRLYPTGSSPGKFYGTAKRHKLKNGCSVDDLPLRPIISNVRTALYQLTKYLAKLLSPLSKSQYTVNNTKEFIEMIKKERVPSSYKMISFDVSSLFTLASLDYTIDLTLKRIYGNKGIETKVSRNDMKNLLSLCTKNVHLTFGNNIYQQKDGVAMEYPLGPMLAGIFMVHLERTLMPELEKFMKTWKRYVNDTITFIKPDFITNVYDTLNKFHQNIKFTYEVEHNGEISFLDVLLMRCHGKLETPVFRKETNNDIYLHWRSFAPIAWKKGTLRTLIRRAYTICSNDNLLQE